MRKECIVMITSVGKFLRKLRIDNGEILRDMAQVLKVSPAFLSAVENGKKKVPDAWLSKLKVAYSLTEGQMQDLQNAIMESSDIVELNIKNASAGNRELALSFARQFDSLDEKTCEKLFDILNRHKEE